MSEQKIPAALEGSRTDALSQIAAGIAQNLSESREQGARAASGGEQPPPAEEREEAAPVTESGPEPAATRETEGEQPPEPGIDAAKDGEASQGEDDAERGERYTIADFADAAGVTGDDFESRLYVTVKGPDGVPRDVSVAELQNGYRWNAANTQRAQENAEQRKALEANFAQVAAIQDQAESVIQHQMGQLTAAEEALAKQAAGVDWDALRARGDGSYADTMAHLTAQQTQIQTARAQLEQARATVGQGREQLHQQRLAEVLPRAQEQLLEMIPEWRDETTRLAEGEKLGRYAVSQEFTEAEYAQCVDPRVYRVMRKAMLWDESQASGAAARKRIADAPRLTVKPGRRQTPEEIRTEESRRVLDRAVETGRTRDLADAVRQSWGRR